MANAKIRRGKKGELLVERFSPARRVEHVLAIVTFAALVLTGFPQKFQDSAAGHWLLAMFGGLEAARWLHRVFGIVFSIHAVTHLLAIVVGVMTKTMRLTLLPVPKDLRDARDNLRFYLGYESKPPEMPKFDYRQKFEYVGLVLGGLVMVSSGLILLFPSFFAEWLPGWAIPAFRVAHSSEAMLALLVLVVWHMYGAILSPDVFPLDTSVFTGYMPAHELKERHVLEYRRIFGEEGGHEPAARGSKEPPPKPSDAPPAPRLPAVRF